MKSINLIISAIAILASATSYADSKNYKLEALNPGTAEYAATIQWMNYASQNVWTTFYKKVNFSNVSIEQAAVAMTEGRYNTIECPIIVDGTVYVIPLDLESADNEAFVYKSTGGKRPGIYFVQKGFRWNFSTDMQDRVTATIRVATLNGTGLSALEVNEEWHQARQ